MLAAVGYIITATIIAIMEVPQLIKNKLKKELWVFSLLLALATGLSVAISLNIKIPSPIEFMSLILKPLSELLE
jgi:uncharacterized BrkB/YihY/UPF0761 family membrane protein